MSCNIGFWLSIIKRNANFSTSKNPLFNSYSPVGRLGLKNHLELAACHGIGIINAILHKNRLNPNSHCKAGLKDKILEIVSPVWVVPRLKSPALSFKNVKPIPK